MKINPPFGYKEIVPLQKSLRVRLLQQGEIPEFARTLNAIPISFTEFALACRYYPIVFSSGDGGKTFSPAAVLGLSRNENLFYSASGWAPKTYVPAYVRRFPFCMARVTLDRVEQQDRLVCVEKSRVDDAGEALFDAGGQPGQKWQAMQKLLNEYEVDLERSREMCSVLSDYGLLEPFTMQAQMKRGDSFHLTGMHRVDEKKLDALNASQVKNLLRKGFFGRIYAHLLSLDNFSLLLERRAESAPAGKASQPA